VAPIFQLIQASDSLYSPVIILTKLMTKDHHYWSAINHCATFFTQSSLSGSRFVFNRNRPKWIISMTRTGLWQQNSTSRQRCSYCERRARRDTMWRMCGPLVPGKMISSDIHTDLRQRCYILEVVTIRVTFTILKRFIYM